LDRPTEDFTDHLAPDPQYVARDERQVSVFRVGALNIHGRRELCIVRNVSAKGMMIKTYSPVAAGTRISIELKQGELIDATVRWEKDGSAGVEFDQPIEVESLLSQSPDAPRPRMPRIDVDVAATIRDGDNVFTARACDISQGGVCIEYDRSLPRETNVVVTLEGLQPKAAVVRWSNDRTIGLGFSKVIPVGELVDWLHGLHQAGQSSRGVA